LCVVTLQYDYKVDPPLRKCVARMPVKDESPTAADKWFQLVDYLSVRASFVCPVGYGR
jgi:hypothetical protein